jgi:hypothetical protein
MLALRLRLRLSSVCLMINKLLAVGASIRVDSRTPRSSGRLDESAVLFASLLRRAVWRRESRTFGRGGARLVCKHGSGTS